MRFNFGILLLMLGATFLIGASFLARYLGAFKAVDVAENDSPGFTVLFKPHIGPYHQVVDKIAEVEAWAKLNHVPCEKTYGEYLDDPQKTEQARLRSEVGCWVGDGQVSITQALPAEIQTRFVPPSHVVEASFSGSPAIGPWKVYPQALGYMADHKLSPAGPTFEIYTVKSAKEMTTHYLFPTR
jgi:hypothetical protein